MISKKETFRIDLVLFFFTLLLFLILSRLFYWQVIKSKELSSFAQKQYQQGEKIIAPRGNILARDGSYLVVRVPSWTIFAEKPAVGDDYHMIGKRLAPFFIVKDEKMMVIDYEARKAEEERRIVNLLANKNLVWIPLKRRVDDQIKKEIEKLKIDGIGFEEEENRYYPEGSSAAHIVGFVGKNENGNDEGYFGLEGYYDLELSGKSGFSSGEKDARGAPLLLGKQFEYQATKGGDLITSIDKGLQYKTEEKLKKAVEKYGAKAGTVIIMDPKTGEIFTLANYPSFDPREFFKFDSFFYKNTAVSDSFEPGSIFKVIVMAAALDGKAVIPETVCDICDKAYSIDKYLIETWNKKYYPNSSMTDVITHSDNVGMVFVGNKLGKDKLYSYLDEFGFGKKTGIDLQGEISPFLKKGKDWSLVDLATVTFGQGIAVTPMQMVKAVGIIANNGKDVIPRVVKEIKIDESLRENKSGKVKRIISEKTSQEISLMMVEAAKSGESKWTYKSGFGVAGKTGTAQIPIAGHYDPEKTIASFIGFAPYDEPKFVMLVTLQEPKTSQWASETAAPLWYSIASDLFLYFGMQPK